jgi:hypothetical protein
VRVDNILDSTRRDHFAKKAFTASIAEGRRQREAETKRMEAYRKLCAEEGIVSTRLQEYDAQRSANRDAIDSRLKAVDEDVKLSHADRKREKFKIKRSAAKRSSEMAPIKSVGATLQEKAEKVREQREAERAAKEAEIQARVAQKAERIEARHQKNKKFALRTASGQPVMAGRIGNLLQKAMKLA